MKNLGDKNVNIFKNKHTNPNEAKKRIRIKGPIRDSLNLNGIFKKLLVHLVSSLYFISVNELTPWLMEPGGSITHSEGRSCNACPEPNQPNSSY